MAEEEDINLVRRELVETREALEQLNVELVKAKKESNRPVQVTVAAPSKIRQFAGNREETDAWLEEARHVLLDSSKDPDPRIKASLHGVAAETVVTCKTNEEILKVIRCTFSDIVDADEELMRFQNTVPQDNERPSTYLIRLYEKLLKISRDAISPIPKEEIMNKLYRTFLSNSKKTYPLLGLAVQACFGMATTESDLHFADILQFVKKEEEACQVQAAAKTASHNSAQKAEPTTEELVEAVTQRVLRSLQSGGHPAGPRNDPSKPRCYACGEVGHIRRRCPNQGNERGLVGMADRQAGRRGRWNDRR